LANNFYYPAIMQSQATSRGREKILPTARQGADLFRQTTQEEIRAEEKEGRKNSIKSDDW